MVTSSQFAAGSEEFAVDGLQFAAGNLDSLPTVSGLLTADGCQLL